MKKILRLDDAIEIDAEGKYVAPGFIDIHVHGGGGYDFMDATETAFLKIAETHAQYGTTAMLPTTLTSTKELLLQTLDAFESANNKEYKWRTIARHAFGRPLYCNESKWRTRSAFYKRIRILMNTKKSFQTIPALNDGVQRLN